MSIAKKNPEERRKKKPPLSYIYLSLLIGIAFLVGYLFSTSRNPEGPPLLTSVIKSEEIEKELNCPCGNCSHRLNECTCTHSGGATEVKGFIQSQIEKGLSKEAILSEASKLYGEKVLAKGTPDSEGEKKVPPFVETNVDFAKIPETLPPESFSGKVKEAYEVAREIPEVLLQLPCYCWCDRIGHGSLLDCFVDHHGENCIICQEEAFRAEVLSEKGEPIPEIREKIISEFREYKG